MLESSLKFLTSHSFREPSKEEVNIWFEFWDTLRAVKGPLWHKIVATADGALGVHSET